MIRKQVIHGLNIAVLGLALGFASSTMAANCAGLPSHAELTNVLRASIYPTGGPSNGGFNLNMWATVVNRDGQVCQVAMSGNDRGDQWPGSRVISAQKANTANSFSLPGLALSTANLFSAVQPGGSLFGLQHSNPVDAAVAYGNGNAHGGGNAKKYGTRQDPMVGRFIGGVNVFGGGLALYSEGGTLLGALGVSGDSSCADHNIAWRIRNALGLQTIPVDSNDRIIYDIVDGVSASGFGHPLCGGMEDTVGGVIDSVIIP